MRIIQGPAVVGNNFGFFGSDLPAGCFAVVVDGEYANGGSGPSVVGPIYGSRARAEQALAELTTETVKETK